MKATPEQRRCLDLFNTGEALRVEAGAGSGKTTTLRYIAYRGRGMGRTLYTAFAKKLVEDAKGRFPGHVEVRTNHSLAFRPMGSLWQREGRLVGRITAAQLAQLCGWGSTTFYPYASLNTGAYAVLKTIERFCQCADDNLSRRHVFRPPASSPFAKAQLEAAVLDRAREVWARMMKRGDTMPITHDVYLKAYLLTHPNLGYRHIVLDEAQDTTELLIAAFQEQAGTQLIVVGDRYQQIHAWRGAHNAMDSFQTPHVGRLTQSFRFGPAVAEVANKVLENYLGADMRIVGFDGIASRLARAPHARAVISRTNATLIGELIRSQIASPNGRFAVVGGTGEMEALVLAAEGLMRGERTLIPELADFEDWREVKAAAQDDAYAYLRNLVELVEDYGTSLLLGHLRRAKGNEQDESTCQQIFSTTHKAKGREFDSVRLTDDFAVKPPSLPNGEMPDWDPEEGNLLYVAVTRAKQVLDISGCSAAQDALAGPLPVPEALTYGASSNHR